MLIDDAYLILYQSINAVDELKIYCTILSLRSEESSSSYVYVKSKNGALPSSTQFQFV